MFCPQPHLQNLTRPILTIHWYGGSWRKRNRSLLFYILSFYLFLNYSWLLTIVLDQMLRQVNFNAIDLQTTDGTYPHSISFFSRWLFSEVTVTVMWYIDTCHLFWLTPRKTPSVNDLSVILYMYYHVPLQVNCHTISVLIVSLTYWLCLSLLADDICTLPFILVGDSVVMILSFWCNLHTSPHSSTYWQLTVNTW